jgi:hypothetical protein
MLMVIYIFSLYKAESLSFEKVKYLFFLLQKNVSDGGT